jgi:hypothetical protein
MGPIYFYIDDVEPAALMFFIYTILPALELFRKLFQKMEYLFMWNGRRRAGIFNEPPVIPDDAYIADPVYTGSGAHIISSDVLQPSMVPKSSFSI